MTPPSTRLLRGLSGLEGGLVTPSAKRPRGQSPARSSTGLRWQQGGKDASSPTSTAARARGAQSCSRLIGIVGEHAEDEDMNPVSQSARRNPRAEIALRTNASAPRRSASTQAHVGPPATISACDARTPKRIPVAQGLAWLCRVRGVLSNSWEVLGIRMSATASPSASARSRSRLYLRDRLSAEPGGSRSPLRKACARASLTKGSGRRFRRSAGRRFEKRAGPSGTARLEGMRGLDVRRTSLRARPAA
jgi:hypothetical protein